MFQIVLFGILLISTCDAVDPSAPLPSLAPTPSVVPPAVPTPYGRIPFVPGYNNNPYYNQGAGANVPILSYSNENNGDGNYAFSFATADGKQAEETGFLKDSFIDNAGQPQGTQVVQGSYSYVSPDGTPIQVSYTADENGFRTSGVHIPSDGVARVPPSSVALPLGPKHPNDIYNPIYNGYNNHYNQNPYGPYNGIRPFDPRDPVASTRFNPYSPYNNGYKYNNGYNRGYNSIRDNWFNRNKEQPKKEAA